MPVCCAFEDPELAVRIPEQANSCLPRPDQKLYPLCINAPRPKRSCKNPSGMEKHIENAVLISRARP